MSAPPDDDRLDRARLEADPVADFAVDRLLAPCWSAQGLPLTLDQALSPLEARVALINAALSSWQTNADVARWVPPPGTPDDVAEVLSEYLIQTQAPPSWVRSDAVARAEHLFFEEGVLSCLLLFCASLPECYVAPDLAEVLHTTGQLESRTEHRIRATAAMVFPVMMRGGLLAPNGGGRAQILKVRLIHAMVRHLILRGTPVERFREAALPAWQPSATAAAVAPSFVSSLLQRGWPQDALGLPCNQEELAYTLLTFGYVMLRGLRTLGVPHAPDDERALLHTWNVMGALVGVRPDLMAHTMDEAEVLFQRMQARSRLRALPLDPRPALGAALMDSMARVIPWGWAKHWPVLMTRQLCGASNASTIGLGPQRAVPWASAWSYRVLQAVTGGIDGWVRRVLPRFSLARMVGRLLGYHLMSGFLMDQTRPLRLPEGLREQMRQTVGRWGEDSAAPGWVNRLEDWWTGPGAWHAPRS
jgi:hypothetical protein